MVVVVVGKGRGALVAVRVLRPFLLGRRLGAVRVLGGLLLGRELHVLWFVRRFCGF